MYAIICKVAVKMGSKINICLTSDLRVFHDAHDPGGCGDVLGFVASARVASAALVNFCSSRLNPAVSRKVHEKYS